MASIQTNQQGSGIGILGTGTWGIALGRILARAGHQVTMWSALPQELEVLTQTHRHPNLPEMEVPDSIIFTSSIEAACQAEVVIFAVPSMYIRSTARAASPYIRDQILVDVAKGIEPDTLLTMSQIISQETGSDRVVVLSGPTHAEQVARDLPTTIVSAGEHESDAKRIQDLFGSTCMRVYTNTDVKGVQLCGATKNIVALASGICTGLGYGDNARAALITRGMAQITRLGRTMGCCPQTFNGLAGIGDLIVTATSVHSRNNRCGRLIGEGIPVRDAIAQVGMVVEGVHAIPAAMALSRKYGVELPIISAVDSVINGGCDPEQTVRRLMNRDLKSESWLHYEDAIMKNGASAEF